MSAILIQPHDDDAVLFACWTILRHKPLVVTVFDSYVQPGRGIPGTMAAERAQETAMACSILNVPWLRLGFRDDDITVTSEQIRSRLSNALELHDEVFLPAIEAHGHPQHNLVAECMRGHQRYHERYLTYTTEGKSTSCTEVPFEPEWVALKLRALAEFKSQFQPAAGCVEHFLRGLREYML